MRNSSELSSEKLTQLETAGSDWVRGRISTEEYLRRCRTATPSCGRAGGNCQCTCVEECMICTR